MRGDGTMDDYIEDLKKYLLNLIEEIQNIWVLEAMVKYIERTRHKAG